MYRQLRRVIAFDQFDPRPAELITHGRINARITPGHLVAGGRRQLGQTAHEGAADTENVQMHSCPSFVFASFYIFMPAQCPAGRFRMENIVPAPETRYATPTTPHRHAEQRHRPYCRRGRPPDGGRWS